MTHRTAEGKLVFCSEGQKVCEFCKKVADTRPYGPKGETVCFECAMKDSKAAEEQFKKLYGTKDEDGNIVVLREATARAEIAIFKKDELDS